MPGRADFIAALREADARIAEVAPGAHVEARLRAALRGDPLEEPTKRPVAPRLRRPALAALFVAAAGVAVIEGVSERGRPLPASTVSERDRQDGADADGEVEVDPDGLAAKPSSAAACDDAREGVRCVPRPAPAAPPPSPTSDPRDPERPSPRAPSAPPRSDLDPRRGSPRAPETGALPTWPYPWQTPMAPAPTGGSAPRITPPVFTYGGGATFRSPSEEPGALSARDLFAPLTSRGAAHAQSSKPEPPLWSTSFGEGPTDEDVGCKMPDAWKEIAYLDCKEQGKELVDLAWFDDCGDGRFASMDHACASPSESPVNEQTCTGGSLGDGSTCMSPDSLKVQASEICAKDGGELVDLYFSLDCDDGGSSYAKYMCCKDAPPDPGSGQGACSPGEIIGACLSKDAFVEQVTSKCAAQGLAVAEIGALKLCPDGSIEYGTFLCCPAE